MLIFRIAKRFEIETGHRLHKHPEKCQFPHGHSYTVEVVVRGAGLDGNDMVCDYKALKIVVSRELELLDHAMLVSGNDPRRGDLAAFAGRLVIFGEEDPTTEVLARELFRRIREAFRPGMTVDSGAGAEYTVPEGVVLERVRVWETSSTWAEYSEES